MDLACRGWKAAPTVTLKTVAYCNILNYDLLSGKRLGVIQTIWLCGGRFGKHLSDEAEISPQNW